MASTPTSISENSALAQNAAPAGGVRTGVPAELAQAPSTPVVSVSMRLAPLSVALG